MAEEATPILKLIGHIGSYQDGNLDAREVLVDCLTDLMTFAEQEMISFNGAIDSATYHYEYERRQDDVLTEGT
jgi:hypothetical protein